MSSSARHPRINALLICNRVVRDAETSAISLIDIVDTLIAPDLPYTCPVLLVFARMTDAEGEYDLTLEIVRRDDDQVVGAATPLKVIVDDPLMSTKLVMIVANLTLSQAGHYDFRLWTNGRFADSTALLVRAIQSVEEDEPGHE